MRTRSMFSLAALAAGILATLASGRADAELQSTAHDFSSVAPDGQGCPACHAPHAAKTTELAWNNTLSRASFGWSDASQTSGGTRLPTNIRTWSGSTKVCLSCHDGSVDTRSFASAKPTAHLVSLGHDLKGSHPVAIPYPYNGTKNTYNGITTGEGTLKSGWVPAPAGVKLYSDPAGSAPNNRGLECASCHDPHGSPYGKFLRVSNIRGALCLQCHVK